MLAKYEMNLLNTQITKLKTSSFKYQFTREKMNYRRMLLFAQNSASVLTEY